ncbi:N-acetylmuramoyl-L-alanine amidase [Blastococcus haudaquaticus]|uniref:LGFP repeat-containing protein n=1 Tax=Blastococcus haudaquaticus TaxID=1938745 RepID=A0A286GE39_9ACTN|nr:N-acetylmuramoyl-L-alanine amidase [Blastococcus haudaquaticus]SOD93770.1 LGFP repeat-containing protein [Blastococcus haudaquaticus]
MRRTLAGSIAFLAMSGTILVLPVYAEPTPEAEPVTTAAEEIPLGSVAAPEEAAAVQEGTTAAVQGVPDQAPVLAVQELDTEFSLVGVTWAHDPAVVDTLVQVRARSADGAWGEWTTVGVEDAEQNADSGQETRGGTSPLWTGPSTGVEVELVTRSGAAPTDVKLDLVDPGESVADAHLETPDIQDTADAALALPPVFSRAQWGADERIRTWAPQYAPTIKAATIHHTADSNNYTADDVPAIMRSIYRYHTVSRGWGDIGYNVIADKYGRLWEGRFGGLASTVIGAHAGGFNTGTFGVSMLGNYETAVPPQGMLDAVADIIAWKLSLYGVDPRGRTNLTSGGGGTSRYAAGVVVNLPTVFAHRDVGSTACPGKYAFSRMDDIRSRVTAQVDGGMSAIERRYASDAGLRQSLGAPVGGERWGAGFSFREYANGRLYWSGATDVRVVRGEILRVFLASGGAEVLGVPSTDEGQAGAGGAFNHFTRGTSIYWSPGTGAQVMRGAIRDRWLRTNAEWGLGYPTGGEVPVAGVAGAWKQTFQRGEVYWSEATGAFDLRGGLAQAWAAAGGASRLGLPTTGEVGVPGGAFTQDFSRGYTLVWTSSGTRLVLGGIRDVWLARGGARGVLGLPLHDEAPTSGGGWYVEFTGGTVVWTASSGAVALTGPIGARWSAAGGLGSSLGLPVAVQRATSDGRGQFVAFASGAGIYQPNGSAQAFLVAGDIGRRWTAWGGVSGLGLPIIDETRLGTGAGTFQVFARGKVFSSAGTGVQVVYGAVGAAYDSVGAEWSRLGLPTSGEYAVPGGVRADFQGGRITWTAATNTTTISYT